MIFIFSGPHMPLGHICSGISFRCDNSIFVALEEPCVEGGVLVHTVHWLRCGVGDVGDHPLVDKGPVNLGVRAGDLDTPDIRVGEELISVMPHGEEVWVQLLVEGLQTCYHRPQPLVTVAVLSQTMTALLKDQVVSVQTDHLELEGE